MYSRPIQLLCTQLALLFFVFFCASSINAEPVNSFKRERIEWCDVWIPEADTNELPRVLLVGDSITRAYYKTVAEHLEGKAFCARFATSACVTDPAFLAQLRAVSTGYTFDIIHFNNGLHGFDYTEEEYESGYSHAVKLLRTLQPQAKIIFALTTPLQSTSDKHSLNSRVEARNNFVRRLANEQNKTINNLHSLSKDHPEYYTDPYHFKPMAIQLQGKQVSEHIRKELSEK